MAKIESLDKRRKKKEQQAASRPCSFSAVSDKGNQVYGIAAFLVISKRNGGVDNLIRSIANDAAETALQNAFGQSGSKAV